MHRTYSIDMIKGWAALSIVCLHCTNSDAFDSVIHLIGRMAVPMFFIITGYFLPTMLGSGRLHKHIIKILKIFVYSVLLYLLLLCVEGLIKGDIASKLSNVINSTNVLQLLLLGRNPFNVNGGHLWFLIAEFYVLIVLYFYTKHWRIERLFKYIPILFFIGYILSSITDIPRIYYQNWLFIGLPYILLGSYIYRNKDKVSSTKFYFTILLIVFSIIYALEIGSYSLLNLPVHREHYLSIIPLVAIILIWASKYPNIGKDWAITSIGKNLSLYIYIIHFYIVQKMWVFFHGSRWDSKWQMISSILISVFVSYIIYNFKDKIVKAHD